MQTGETEWEILLKICSLAEQLQSPSTPPPPNHKFYCSGQKNALQELRFNFRVHLLAQGRLSLDILVQRELLSIVLLEVGKQLSFSEIQIELAIKANLPNLPAK